VKQIKRIEQTIAGILDSLLLFDRQMFITDDGYSLLKHIVRKIMTTGTFNLPLVIKYWKAYGNSVFNEATETVTLSSQTRDPKNFFFNLDSWPRIQEMRFGNLTRKDLTDLAQLISTRQLPTGDRKVELEAYKTFQDITTEVYNPDSNILHEAYQASRIVGRKCRKAGPGPIAAAHISLATAGSLNHTVLEGGRSKEIIDSITPFLTYEPEVDRLIETPFCTLREEKNVPRWRTWCRSETYHGYPDHKFGETTPETIGSFTVFRQGFDEAIGEQILMVAYFAMQNELTSAGILLRVLTVTEPGCKARIVTTGPWWLYVLQQALAHITRGFLASHPSCEAGMARTDQAWQYLYLARKADFSSLKGNLLCLSSDLKSATDAIPKEVAVQVLQGFTDGLGYYSPLTRIAVDLLLAPRICLIEKEGIVFTSRRGVFMGEPLAKTILTLVNLVAEEISLRKYLKRDITKPIQVPWRCFAIAGDDHIAIGPLKYLEGITAAHIRLGSKISPDKHGHSSIAVRYCEKILKVSNFRNRRWDPKTINDDPESYQASPFIDSIKVRLLSPCSKNNESFNDRNTAVGKASSLGRTLRWMPDDLFDYKWKRLVRDRFFQRMGSLLPDSSSGVFWHLLLPEDLGGLGLWLPEEIPDIAARIPDPTKSFLVDLLEGNADEETKRLFRGLTSNISYRGFTLLESEVSLVRELLMTEIFGYSTGLPLEEARKAAGIADGLSLKQVRNRLRGSDWLTKKEGEDHLLRIFLFKEILSGEAKVSAFNTESFKRRYSKLWGICFKGHTELSADDLKRAMDIKDDPELFYDFSEKTALPIRGEIQMVNLIDEMTIGLPNLKLKVCDMGVLVNPVGVPEEGEFSFGEYV
jgi:hypothetical protein